MCFMDLSDATPFGERHGEPEEAGAEHFRPEAEAGRGTESSHTGSQQFASCSRKDCQLGKIGKMRHRLIHFIKFGAVNAKMR